LDLVAVSTPDFEPELDQPTPRPIRARSGCGGGCGLLGFRLFILPHMIVGLWLLFQSVTGLLLWLGVLLLGTDVEGHVVRKTEHQGKKGSVSYTLDYAVGVGGAEYPGQVALTAAEYTTLGEGDAVTVRLLTWLPQYGHWPRVQSYSPLGNVASWWGICLFWNGILSVFVWQFYILPWLLWWLVRYGRPTRGVVRSVNSWTGKGGVRYYRITYEYTSDPIEVEAGGAYSGSGTAGPPHTRTIQSAAPEAATVQVGDVLTVLYDPRRPQRSLLYRFADYQVSPLAP
jgi:hypothetical protein